MGHPSGLLETGGDSTSIPEFRINIFQVPLEAVAFQPLPQLHSALDAVGRKYHRGTMEIMKLRPSTPKRKAERNPTDTAVTENTGASAAALFSSLFCMSLSGCFDLSLFGGLTW